MDVCLVCKKGPCEVERSVDEMVGMTVAWSVAGSVGYWSVHWAVALVAQKDASVAGKTVDKKAAKLGNSLAA